MYSDVLAQAHRVVVVGATADPDRYGFEVLTAFCQAGYDVVAVNPRYDLIDVLPCYRLPCYPSLDQVPGHADLAVLVLSPANALEVLPQLPAAGIATVWLPPGTASDETRAKADALGLTTIADVCPVGILSGSTPLGGIQ